MFFLEWKDTPKSPSVVTTLAVVAMNDPAAAVHGAIKARLGSECPPRRLAKSHAVAATSDEPESADEKQRIAAPWYYLNSANFGISPDSAVAPLRKLSEDSSEKARVLAAKAVAKIAGLQTSSDTPASALSYCIC